MPTDQLEGLYSLALVVLPIARICIEPMFGQSSVVSICMVLVARTFIGPPILDVCAWGLKAAGDWLPS